MKFKNYEDYETMRAAMTEECSSFIDEGDTEKFENKMDEIRKLDEEYDEYSKMQANLRALDEDKRTVPSSLVGKVQMSDDVTNDTEYRKAFMNYVVSGKAMPAKFKNEDANTTTSDVGVMIPETVLNRIVEKLEKIGNIYNLVTKTNYKGGIKVPTTSVKPTATWVAEGAGSDKQKSTVSYISFGYNKLRCAVSMSLEVATMALPVFETTFVKQVSEAMIKAIEAAIINGTGSAQPKGLLTETPEKGQALTVAKTGSLTYKLLCDAEGALPEGYEAGAVWLMSKKTFMEFTAMVDSNGQPVARTNYGIGGKAERMILGRPVITTDNIAAYSDTVEADTIFACLFRLEDYILNANLNMTIKTYEDNETDDTVTKAIMLVDGKAVDINSLVTITKKSA